MWQDFENAGIRQSASPSESARFGMPVARVSVGVDAPVAEASFRDQFAETVAAVEADVIVVRYPAAAIWLGSALTRPGFDTLPAGALTYWEVEAGALALQSCNDPEVAEISPDPRELRPVVRSIVADSFDGYANHYAVNPRFPQELAREGYLEWAEICAADPDNIVVLGHGGAPVGVATLAQSSDGRDLEVLLAGIITQSQGQGWYSALLGAVGRNAVSRGCQRMIISTQVHNVRVQRAWVRAGLRPFGAIETVHLLRK